MDDLNRLLESVDDRSTSEYSTFKTHFQQYQMLVQAKKDLTPEQTQQIVDLILTKGDFEAQIEQLLSTETNESSAQSLITRFSNYVRPIFKADRQRKSSRKGSALCSVSDKIFLNEVCTKKRPEYQQVALRILQSAEDSLCTRLCKLYKDILVFLEDHLEAILSKRVKKAFEDRHTEARQRSRFALCEQIRNALADEADAPGNRFVEVQLPFDFAPV